MTSFHLPTLNSKTINTHVGLLSPYSFICMGRGKVGECSLVVPAIACSGGFPSSRDGVHVFVVRIDEIVGHAAICIGLTSSKNKEFSTTYYALPSLSGMNGVCLNLIDGCLLGGTGEDSEQWIDEEYFSGKITSKAREVVCITTITHNGTRRMVQFVVDGHEGDFKELNERDFISSQTDEWHDSAEDDEENDDDHSLAEKIFPVVTVTNEGQKIEFVPFDQVRFRSRKINQLLREFNNQRKDSNKDKKDEGEEDAD